MKTYGQNLKAMRKRARLNQEEMARRMGLTRQGNLSQYENDVKFPTPELVRQHAKAAECQPWELLDQVETEYDRLRSGSPIDRTVTTDPGVEAERARLSEAQTLLRRYEREQARMEAAHPADRLATITEQILAIGKELRAWRPPAMARRSRPGVSPRTRNGGQKSRRKPATKATEK